MVTKEEMNKRFFTKEGIEALETRMKTLCDLFNKGEYPIDVMILGFGKLQVRDNNELLGRISEISNLIGFQARIIKRDDGNKITERIEY